MKRVLIVSWTMTSVGRVHCSCATCRQLLKNSLDDSDAETAGETPCNPGFNHVPPLLGSSSSSARHLEHTSLVSAPKTLSMSNLRACMLRTPGARRRQLEHKHAPETRCDSNSLLTVCWRCNYMLTVALWRFDMAPSADDNSCSANSSNR
jgi:hypothetical protein